MLELALSEDQEGLYQKDIAIKQDISVNYLDQIIAALKTAGLIRNAGGKKSGYVLNKPKEDISIYDVYLAFEEDLAIIGCLIEGDTCPRGKHCVLREFWCGLNNNIKDYMESMSLSQLVHNFRNKQNKGLLNKN